MPLVYQDQPLWAEAVAVAKELVPGYEENPERHRIVVALTALLYREALPILPPYEDADRDSN